MLTITYTSGRVFERFPSAIAREDALREIYPGYCKGVAYLSFYSDNMEGLTVENSRSNFTGAFLRNATIVSPQGSNFTTAQLESAKFQGQCHDIDLSGCDIRTCDFTEAAGIVDCGKIAGGRIILNLRAKEWWALVNYKTSCNFETIYTPLTDLPAELTHHPDIAVEVLSRIVLNLAVNEYEGEKPQIRALGYAELQHFTPPAKTETIPETPPSPRPVIKETGTEVHLGKFQSIPVTPPTPTPPPPTPPSALVDLDALEQMVIAAESGKTPK